MEGNGDETETINVWELMKDLDDDEKSPRSKHLPTASLSNQRSASAMASARLPTDSFTLEPSDVRGIPPWLSSFHMHSGRGTSVAGPSDGSLRDVSTFGTVRSKCGPIGGSTSHVPELFGDKLSVLPHETLAEHLQRSLSFEASRKKEMKTIFGQRDAFDARQSKGLKMGFCTDESRSTSAWPLSEGDVGSSPSTPSFSSPSTLPFSGSVGRKKLLQDDSHTSKRKPDLKAAFKILGHEPQSKLPPQQVTPPLAHATKVTGPSLKETGGSYNMGGYANHNVGARHNPDVSAHDTPSVGRSKIPQEGRVRRFRHSFSDGNREKQLTEERSTPAVTRPSSWELGKLVVDPNVKVVLYSTSSQADAHTFEDSNAVRAILISLVGASFDEKSISQHPEYEQELKIALNMPIALVPAVCVKGRFIAGLDNIMQFYKKGILGSLLQEPLSQGLKPNAPCICRGGKFLICPVCKGKRKLVRPGEDVTSCRHCSGTGLIKCPSCLDSV